MRFPVIILVMTLAWAAHARDAFVILSGGISPMNNNYSQYLQAKALMEYFGKNYPPESVWLFFGAGNEEGQKPVLGDVYHKVKHDGVIIDTWQAGLLPRNHPARRSTFLKVLREQILPTVASGGTLYLFVGDHGSRTSGRDAESVIDLWEMRPDPDGEHGWTRNEDESLGVSELRAVLQSGIGKGKLVFCMTQCHSGGFHYLSIPHEMTPNSSWFAKVPAWAKRAGEEPITLKAAGFTATDENSVASGCDPSPDPDEWAGYERYIPEKLLGLDLFTLKKTGPGLPSFAAAHAAATLVDQTIDKPYSTSEQYLERWANLIEHRLAGEKALTSKTKNAVTAYRKVLDGASSKNSDAAFKERQALFKTFTEKLAEQNSSIKAVLLTGHQRELEDVTKSQTMDMGPDTPPMTITRGRGRGRRGAGGGGAERRRLWNETVRPAWKVAVEADGETVIPAEALEFEKYLLKQEDEGASYLFGGTDSMRDELFWHAGYGQPQTLDKAKAEVASAWVAVRRTKILDWAKEDQNEAVRNAGERLTQLGPGRGGAPPAGMSAMMDTMERAERQRAAAERVLFYRRVLGAWEFLLTMNERPALAQVKELTELERTPLPKPRQ